MGEHLTERMPDTQDAARSRSAFRVDETIHDLVMDKTRTRPSLAPTGLLQALPDPVFPRHPKLLARDEAKIPQNLRDYRRKWTPRQILGTMRAWAVPYVKSRVLAGDFQPIIAYLFTEYKCNLECHYCWAFDNRVKGMTEDAAKRSIDWLHTTPCRALALMGGEPLLRPQFVHKVVDYATQKGFWCYLPTNGRLLRPDVIDRVADGGVKVFNLATDAVNEKPGLPKALAPIRANFDYLVKRQFAYGYVIFLNINICRNNLDDVRELTEIAHDHGLATDYHINESPMTEQDHFKHLQDNPTFITPEDHAKVDELVDWLCDKQRAGYKMANSIESLQTMKAHMRGALQEWNCRAGQNTVIIRVDGTLAPCFPMYSATYDWGTVEHPVFDVQQLADMKQNCQSHCFSTLNHIVGYCYNDARVIKWLGKQAARGFQGVTGTFE
jgi:MoaA/NifB/PqqE/SkfB family radical SAM enzyme